MANSFKKIAVAYVPVLHAGYRNFLSTAIEQGAEAIYLIGDDILAAHDELDYMNRKDRLRAIPVERMQVALTALSEVPVEILTREEASSLGAISIIAPQEDVTELLVREYFKEAEIERVPIFLRWHRDNTAEERAVEAHRSIWVTDADRELMQKAFDVAEASFDWWRQVGSLIVKDGQILFVAYNKRVPDEQSPYVNGDPRTSYRRGVEANLTTAAHGEGVLIAEAARAGVSLTGASIYVTDFPCPYCARIIAHSGISKCYFARGYAALDGADVLRQKGVELIYVDMKKEQG